MLLPSWVGPRPAAHLGNGQLGPPLDHELVLSLVLDQLARYRITVLPSSGNLPFRRGVFALARPPGEAAAAFAHAVVGILV